MGKRYPSLALMAKLIPAAAGRELARWRGPDRPEAWDQLTEEAVPAGHRVAQFSGLLLLGWGPWIVAGGLR